MVALVAAGICLMAAMAALMVSYEKTPERISDEEMDTSRADGAWIPAWIGYHPLSGSKQLSVGEESKYCYAGIHRRTGKGSGRSQ